MFCWFVIIFYIYLCTLNKTNLGIDMNMLQNVARWYFSKRALPFWVILLLDCLMVVMAAILVAVLVEGPVDVMMNWKTLAVSIGAYLWCYFTGFRTMHTYSGIIRYSTFVDLQRVAFANIIGLALSFVVRWGLIQVGFVPLLDYVDLLIISIVATSMMWLMRVTVKFVYDMGYNSKRAKRVFVFGVRRGGVSIAKSLRSEEFSKYVLAGFVTADESYIGRRMMGVRVFRNDVNMVEEMKLRGATVLLVSPVYNEVLRNDPELLDRLIEENIHIHMMPQSYEWDGKSDLNHVMLKEVEIEDLLPRDKIEIDMDKVGGMLTGKRILITGAAGSIGSEMVRQVAVYNPAELILIDQAETPMHDVRLYMGKHHPGIKTHTIVTSIGNASRMEEVYKQFRPEYVFHAAAYKHVPMMEDNVSESIQVNVFGTRTVADLAVKYGAEKFVMISTDKAVNPTNVMGCSKRICEIYVQSLAKKLQKEGGHATQFITTRFGNVLGSNGSVIPRFRDQIQRGGPVTVTHPEIIRYFMTIPEACRLVLEAGSMGNGGEIYIFDMGKPVKIVDLAKRMISLSGRTDVKIEFTGLRHGEKLYEELLNVKELTKPTYHEKIMIATVREYDYDEVKERIQKLIDVSYTYDQMKIVAAMKDIVPEFVSKNSCFEALDKKK